MAKRKTAKTAPVKITAKLAHALCMQELGTAKGLKKSESFDDRYEMRMGNLVIEIRPSYSYPGLVELNHCMYCQGGFTTHFYHPDTLEVDFGTVAREHTLIRMEYVKDWVDSHSDLESCKEDVDRIWNRPY